MSTIDPQDPLPGAGPSSATIADLFSRLIDEIGKIFVGQQD